MYTSRSSKLGGGTNLRIFAKYDSYITKGKSKTLSKSKPMRAEGKLLPKFSTKRAVSLWSRKLEKKNAVRLL